MGIIFAGLSPFVDTSQAQTAFSLFPKIVCHRNVTIKAFLPSAASIYWNFTGADIKTRIAEMDYKVLAMINMFN